MNEPTKDATLEEKIAFIKDGMEKLNVDQLAEFYEMILLLKGMTEAQVKYCEKIMETDTTKDISVLHEQYRHISNMPDEDVSKLLDDFETIKKKVAVKRVGKPIEIIETDTRYRTDFAKSVINNYAEYIQMQDGWLFCCADEEGLIKNLPVNFLMEMQSTAFPLQKITGDVVFVRCKPVDYMHEEVYDLEIEDLTESDISLINSLLSENQQAELKSRFNDYGSGAIAFELF